MDQGAVVDDRYRLVQKIGSGGMADVWLAEDPHLQRHVALKILHRQFAQDREFVERFRLEAESAAGLQHPNIVSIYDRGEVNGTYYIAMQYVQGRSLKQLIDEGLSTQKAVALIRQVLEAAGFAHRNGVVHRDLKPQNVLVDGDGKAIVTDFGIARAGASEITRAGSVMGTPHYLSPEQAQGFDVTAVSDLYSIGMVLFEALTGRVPFEADSAVAIAMKQVSEAPQRPSSINPKVSPALDAVVMRALEKEPGNRFQNADAFIAALDAAIQDPGGGRGTAMFAPLPPTVALPGDELSAEEEAARKRRRWIWIAVALAVLIGALIGFLATRDTTTTVPDVTESPKYLAEARLEEQGFSIGKPHYVSRSEGVPGTVLESDPPPGKTSLDCSFLSLFCSKPTVILTINRGPGETKVPSTTHQPQAKAAAALEDAGFEVQVQKVNSNSVDEGLVIHSDPPGGSTATEGSTVVLTVSKGPKLQKVPVLVGSQRGVAEERIHERGLVPDVREEESSAPGGQVIRQSPNAGSELPRGASVTIVVSKEEEMLSVPNAIGVERKTAVEELRELGFKPSVQEQETEVPSQVGRVTDQFPPPGSEVKAGTVVTLVVGKAAAGSTPPESE
jgi:beta-lactam-binding protein with PASTA domain/predicted Ser/Thr protein kinase